MLSNFITQSGLTRSTWAERLGVSRSYLSDVLNGNRRPSLDLAVRIARLTGGAVPVESWVPGEPVSERPLGDAA
jgi:transcriptional regulator with XRE-family HTH domain